MTGPDQELHSEVAAPLVRDMLSGFERNGVRYCHWKSNEHAVAAVQAHTDLDILFDEADKLGVEKILFGLGFKKFTSAWYARYPEIFDYLSIDVSTGRVVHVHAHFRLVLGEARVKSYCLPWGAGILANRVWLPEAGMYASAPEDEAVLLLVRMVLKRMHRKRALSADAVREFEWLMKRVEKSGVSRLVETRIGPGTGKVVEELCKQGLTLRLLGDFAKAALPYLRASRRMGYVQSAFWSLIRFFYYSFSRVNKRFRILDIPNNRLLPDGGLVVAILGADGSGKSTQAARISRVLGKKMDVSRFYMGSGNGQASVVRRPLNALLRMAKTRRVTGGQRRLKEMGRGRLRPIQRLAKTVFATVLAFERRGKLKRIKRARRRGAIVVCDRYPQATIRGYNDGPLLDQNDLFAGWEQEQYELASHICPDLVLKLLGDPVVLQLRRADENSLDQIFRKQSGIADITFPESVRTVVIDATASEEDVFRAAMRAIAETRFATGASGRDRTW